LRTEGNGAYTTGCVDRLQAGKAGTTMLNGLYKVEMRTVHGSRRGVLYVYDGKMMGGNSAFAFIGSYRESAGGEVWADVSTIRGSSIRPPTPRRRRIPGSCR
jgi:hypothetical protein